MPSLPDLIGLLIIGGLATWRVSSLFVEEAGPGDIFLRLRELAGIEHGPDKKITVIPDGFFSGVLSCVWCCSIWVGGFWAILYLLLPLPAFYLSLLFTFSALAILVQKRVEC